jgi:hypothetical protein
MRHKLLHILIILATLFASFSPAFATVAHAQSTPTLVNIPGTHQDELGCPGEWQPECENTKLTLDTEDDVYQGTYEIQPANDDDKKGPRYKVALNGGWGENYGVNAALNGADIPLVVTEPTQVKFYYDHKTHWVADSFNNQIVVAMGDFQKQIGCLNDNDATCLRAWLQDPDGDGLYDTTVRVMKAGTYNVTFTLSEDATNVIGEPQTFTVAKDGDAIYFGYDSVNNKFTISTSGAPVGNLNKQRAIWVNKDTILWKISGGTGLTYALIYSPDAALELSPEGILNGTEIALTYVAEKPSMEIFRDFPYLSGYAMFKLTDTTNVADILKGQVAVVARTQSGQDVDATGVQIPGALDDIYKYDGPLGVTFDGSVPTLRVWAPTAQAVTLHMFDTEKASYANKTPMEWDAATGVWNVTGDETWKGKYYLYEVKVFAPSTGKIETNLVTDPYSFSLSINSKRSQVVDLNDAALKPQGWDAVQKPALTAPEDIVLYELHIRDFSISDGTVPEEVRGTYRAFTVKDSNGMKHLAALAQAGLTHIHLLPAFDIASVNEDKSTWQSVDEEKLKALPPDSDQQSIAVSALTGSDGFNWGYDPLHYTTPEGSYATDPNGTPAGKVRTPCSTASCPATITGSTATAAWNNPRAVRIPPPNTT